MSMRSTASRDLGASRGAARTFAVFRFGCISALASCTQIFGFEAPAAFCHLNSDCPSDQLCAFGGCTVGCKENRDCTTGVCSDGACRAPDNAAVTDAATGDERVAKAAAGFTDDGAVDASISTCDAGANDSFNCGRCGNACAPGVCEESECRNVVDQGYYAVTVSPRGPFFPVSPGFGDGGTGQTVGLQIQVLQGGWVIGLGTLTEFGGTHGYLGLYRDTGGGQPSTLVAQTAEFTLKGDTRSSADPQPTVEPVGPVLVPAGYYWIFGTWNGDVAFAEQGGSPDCSAGCVNWYQLNGPFQPLPASLLPKEFQRGPEIILYAEIAIKPS